MDKHGTASHAATQASRVMTHKSEGQFDPSAWIREGNHLFVSAKGVRAAWVVKRQKFRRLLRDGRPTAKAMAEMEGLPKASLLLLGYAVEMYLKAGLSKLYVGCPEELFDHDVRKKYGHDFKELAKAVSFERSQQDARDLKTLQRMVLYDARYPVKPSATATMTRLQAERMWVAWNGAEFARLRQLALRVKAHVSMIDRDSCDPLTVSSASIDDDGYVVLRMGGRLPPRVTYRFSSAQEAAGEARLDKLRELANAARLVLLSEVWDQAKFYEHPADVP